MNLKKIIYLGEAQWPHQKRPRALRQLRQPGFEVDGEDNELGGMRTMLHRRIRLARFRGCDRRPEKGKGGALMKYKTPPKRVFRSLGLGIEHNGIVRVIAGFRQAKWWDSFPSPEPLFVQARIIRRKAVRP